jgi:hypothetical protein
MEVMTMSSIIDEEKLNETLTWRSDEVEFGKCLKSIKNQYGQLDLIHILDECDLEKSLWAVRALSTDHYDADIRLMACEVVESILRNEQERHSYIDDPLPFQAIEVSRAYAKGLLNENQRRQFENRITYSQWGQKAAPRMEIRAPRLFSGKLFEAAIETMFPEVGLAAYFSILTAHSIDSRPEVYEADTESKTKIVREFFESLH